MLRGCRRIDGLGEWCIEGPFRWSQVDGRLAVVGKEAGKLCNFEASRVYVGGGG